MGSVHSRSRGKPMTGPEFRVAIAVPHRNGQCHIALARTMAAMDMSGVDVKLLDNSASSIVENRNALVQQFLDLPFDCTHMFFIDSDMTVPPDGLKKLLAADKPVISGVCVDKRDMLFIVRKRIDRFHYRVVQEEWSKYPMGSGPHWIIKDELRDKVLPCDAAGAGCLMIKREVFEGTPYPWFYQDFNPEQTGHNRESLVSEDFTFFYKAQQAGFECFVHTGVLCDHWLGTAKFPPFWQEQQAPQAPQEAPKGIGG